MKEEIIKLRKEGKTINEIIKLLGCSKGTISYHINKVRLGGNIKIYNTEEMVIKYRSELKSYTEIIELLGISEDRLKKICRKYNLNIPSNHFGVKIKLNKDEVI